ncbi:MAG: hypothetical protein EOP54_17570 [Sphingobacteriales bacterium]|nr:MAG: hypothetical protein EOP54_17570 [Sphingobacteriales bacterium]
MIAENPALGKKLHPDFPYNEAEVTWAIRNEMVETVEDILSRRLRVLFIDAQAAIEMSKKVASILAKELNADQDWEDNQVEIFNKLALGYIYQPNNKKETASA